jgi:hypothetical protein
MTDFVATAPVIVEYRIERSTNLSEEMRRYYEHLRRQAIEDIRFYDLQLYGRNNYTIPERRR